MLDEQIKAHADRITKTKHYLEILENLEIAATTKIQVSENTVSHKKDEYEQAKKMKSAVQSLTSIFSSSWLTKSMVFDTTFKAICSSIDFVNQELLKIEVRD